MFNPYTMVARGVWTAIIVLYLLGVINMGIFDVSNYALNEEYMVPMLVAVLVMGLLTAIGIRRYWHDKAADKFSVGAGRISPEAVQKSEGKGVTKYHVTIELIADGDNSFKVKYTIAELNVENPQTYEFTTTDSFPKSGRMAFVFGASHLSYRISNFSVTNAQ